MRTYPDDQSDLDELARLKVKPWQSELLKFNPAYPHWGPHEDHMISKGSGWGSSQEFETWSDFGPWGLDELNECVNFYFFLSRESKVCMKCKGGRGYHPDAQWISESFYGHSTPFRGQTHGEFKGRAVMEHFGGVFTAPAVGGYPSEATLLKYGEAFRSFCEEMRDTGGEWNDKITDDEVKALWKEKRLCHFKAKPSASQVNAEQHRGGIVGHDAINRCILIRARCKRLGVPLECDRCEGHGYEFTKSHGEVGIVLWMLHPRKGASRGVEVKKLAESEIPAVRSWLKEAAQRNAQRFARITL